MRSSRDAVVIETRNVDDLDQIQLAQVQAVVYTPPALPAWFAELAAAVCDGRFTVPRTILGDVDAGEIAAWIACHLPVDALEKPSGEALRDDILALVDRVGRTSGAQRFLFRVLTGTPSRHCGFHVDTVPPGAPPWGLLRVYTGAGTHYASPGDVTRAGDFYRYLGRRERLVRELGDADGAARDHLHELIIALDDQLGFLRPGAQIATAPAGSIVAFKHLDVRLHWSDHEPDLAWIHCSPMAGDPRFLVNVTAVRPAGRSARGAIAR